jgi:site-specific recombinase XerD
MKRSGTIRKRGKFYHLRYIIEGCAFTVPLRTSSRSEADEDAEVFMRNRQSGLDQYEAFLDAEKLRIQRFRNEDSASKILLSDAWDLFVGHDDRPKCGAGSLKQYKSAWSQFVDGLPKKKKFLSDVKEQDAKDRMMALYKRGAAQGTADKHLIYLTAIFKTLLPETAKNPFAKAVARGAEQDSDLSVNPLTIPQMKSLIEIAGVRRKSARTTAEEHEQMRKAFLVLAYTGLRLGDAFGLMIEEVLFERNILRVLVNKTKKKKRKQGKAAYAWIGMHPVLREVLVEQIGDRTSGPVFDLLAGWSAARQSNNVQIIFDRAGLAKKVSTAAGHTRSVYGAGSFRHSMQDRLRNAKVPQTVVNVILCHSAGGMADVYATITDEELIQAVCSAYPDLRPEGNNAIMNFSKAS